MYFLTAKGFAFFLAIVTFPLFSDAKKIISRRFSHFNKENKIVGGTLVKIEEVPWQIAIFLRNAYSPICGGSILSHLFVLTAAHCIHLRRPSSIEVRYGTDFIHRGDRGTFVKVLSIHHDPYFYPVVNDVGIIKLKTAIEFSLAAKPVILCKDAPTGGEVAVATGWGKRSEKDRSRPNNLLQVSVVIVDFATCQKYYEATPGPVKVMKGMLCAAEALKGVCKGDSGGALTVKGKQVGIVSWSEGCAETNFPAVYTQIADYRNYIDMITLNTTSWE